MSETRSPHGRRTRRAICCAVLLVPASWLLSPAASAQAPAPTFSRSPDQGGPGTVISVSGTGCILSGLPMQGAHVYLPTQSQAASTSAIFAVGPDGSWSGELVVSSQAQPGNYPLVASCLEQDQVLGALNSPLPFVVLDRPAPNLTVDPASAASGVSLTASGTGCTTDAGPQEGVTVTLATPPTPRFGPNSIGSPGTVVSSSNGAVAADGSFTVSVQVPPGAVPGDYVVTARCDGASASLQVGAAFRVEAPPATPTPPEPVVVSPNFTG